MMFPPTAGLVVVIVVVMATARSHEQPRRTTDEARVGTSTTSRDAGNGQQETESLVDDDAMLNVLRRQFLKRLGLSEAPRPSGSGTVPDYLKQVLRDRKRSGLLGPGCLPSIVAITSSKESVSGGITTTSYQLSRSVVDNKKISKIELVVKRPHSTFVRVAVKDALDGTANETIIEVQLSPAESDRRSPAFDRYDLMPLLMTGLRRQQPTADNVDRWYLVVTRTGRGDELDQSGEELVVVHDSSATGCDDPGNVPDPATDRPSTRARRSTSGRRRNVDDVPQTRCSLHRWYLDFASLGWSEWIRVPAGYEANYCAGDCLNDDESESAASNRSMSNHAYVKNLYISTAASRGAAAPEVSRLPPARCVPIALSGLDILYKNMDGQWIVREMKEMKAEECGCL